MSLGNDRSSLSSRELPFSGSGGSMRALSQWIQMTFANGPGAIQQRPANGVSGAVPDAVTSKRANCGLLTARNGTELRPAHLRVEELASANRRKDEFLAMLSHELRSPLASIQYGVHVLGRQVGDVIAQQRTQALIERQLRRMTRLVDELLDVSRITSGRLHLQSERLDLRDVVRHAIETLEADVAERNHRLATEFPDVPVWLDGDACRLEQIFVNLLANASRYTDAGGALAVWIHTNDGQAVVRVRDSGIGIAPDALPHIFEIFKQAHETDPRSKAGLGVGLAVVRNLVELHGGSVTAGSAGHGRGSEFTVRLPMATVGAIDRSITPGSRLAAEAT
jgi:two-component system, sensor histidine kinase